MILKGLHLSCRLVNTKSISYFRILSCFCCSNIAFKEKLLIKPIWVSFPPLSWSVYACFPDCFVIFMYSCYSIWKHCIHERPVSHLQCKFDSRMRPSMLKYQQKNFQMKQTNKQSLARQCKVTPNTWRQSLLFEFCPRCNKSCNTFGELFDV